MIVSPYASHVNICTDHGPLHDDHLAKFRLLVVDGVELDTP